MESTAFNRDQLGLDAWNSLHSIRIHCTTLHGIHCIQSRSIGPRCMESTAFNRDPFNPAVWNTLRSIGMHFTMLHGILDVEAVTCLEEARRKISCSAEGSVEPTRFCWRSPTCVLSPGKISPI